MAGAGKTSVGKALSLELGYEFLDTDKMIETSYGKSKDIIDSEGKDRFRVIEEEVLLSINFKNTLLATGGSAVFSPLAMEHLSCLLYTSPSPRDNRTSRMPSSA